MTSVFNEQGQIAVPETSEIRQKVAQQWADAFAEDNQPGLDIDSSTPAGQLIDAQTAEIEAKNADMLYYVNQFNPKTAEGRWQDALGYIYFLTRKVSEPSIVTCQCRGLNGTVIPYGAIVEGEGARKLINTATVTIGSSGVVDVIFRTVEHGAIDIPAHSVTKIITVIPGWDTVDNAAAGATGRDMETRGEFENRRYASVAANAHGSVSAIFGAVADLNGVLDVQVLENIGPNPVVKYGVTVPGHGIVVCVYGGENAEIAEVIYRKKDAGCDTGGNTAISYTAADYSNAVYNYLIMRPATVNFWVKIKLGKGAVLSQALTAAIKTAVYDDFLGQNQHTQAARIGLAQTVYASRFYHAITAVEGANYLQQVTIALADSPTVSSYADVVTINGNQEPVMTEANIIIETGG